MRITKKFIAELTANTKATLKKLSTEDVAYVVKKANEAYHSKAGPIISDDIFDIVKDHLAGLDADNPAVAEVGAVPSSGKKVKLPYYMGSMDKIKSDDRALDNFRNKYKGTFVLTDKLDGISALVFAKDGQVALYTRGDGTTGQDISHLLKYITGIPPTIAAFAASQPNKELTVRGELLLTKAAFETVKNRGANARNMVAGIVNAKTPDVSIAKMVKFMAYSLIEPNTLKPSDAFKLLLGQGFNTVYHELHPSTISFQDMSQVLITRRQESPFEIDGLVVSHDDVHPLQVGKNPPHAFAFKNLITQEIAEVVVTNVEWNASKDGYLIPVIEFEGVQLSGVMVKRATGFNGEYIKSNMIGPGARIVVTRSGDVIPYVLNVLVAAKEPQMPSDAYSWTDSGKDIYLEDSKNNKKVQLKQLENFFTKLAIPGIRGGTIAKLFEAGLDSLHKIINAKPATIAAIDGFQAKSADKIASSIKEKLGNLTCIELMDASNAFGRGFGSRRLTSILAALPDISNDKFVPTKDQLVEIEGVSHTTADAFIKGLAAFREFKKSLGLICDAPTLKKAGPSGTNKTTITFQNQVVVFTGFRDAALKSSIEDAGGEVGDSVTKRTTILVAKDIDKATTKVEKAEKLGVQVFSLADFKIKYKL